MKLVAVMCLESSAADLAPLLRRLQIPVFSETDIRGYYQQPQEVDCGHWFGTTTVPTASKLTLTFVESEQADELLEAIREHNRTRDRAHPVHAFVLNVEAQV